ncbi:caspase family protein [Frederiksenia canicola]
MKKKLVIIGNMDPNLGVLKDISDLEILFTRKEGGAWNNDEIDIMRDPSHYCLVSKIDEYRRMNLDYFLLIFGGHGDSMNNITNIAPSNLEKYDVPETIFDDIAQRQLSIFDCCRYPRKTIRESLESLSSLESRFSEHYNIQLSINEVRKIYEDRIMDSPEHHLKLFSCSIGEYAQDQDGGLYTQSLISQGMNSSRSQSRVTSAISIHQNIKDIVYKKSGNTQTPNYRGLLRVPDNMQFPFIINPTKFL